MQVLAHAPPAVVGMPSVADALIAAARRSAWSSPTRRGGWAVGSVELKLGTEREKANDPVGAAAAYRAAIDHLSPGRAARGGRRSWCSSR